MSRILITGGTGFLGKRLSIRLRQLGHEVAITGRNNKQNLEAARFTGCQTLPMDVCRIESVRDSFAVVKPEVVIHAAATKFVDLSEKQPMEAIDVNVVGSQNVARVAIEKGARLVVGISTDKASPPVKNTYGLTKALMERLFCSMDGVDGTGFLCVRYGNVAWSTGSVLPVWRRMLKETGVIETTGPEMVRFFFTVDEAVELVLTALSRAGELHGMVLGRHMKSARIKDVLELWVALERARYEHVEGRPGDRDLEYLVGELELPYTAEKSYNAIPHFLISFNRKVEHPLAQVVSSGNATRLSKEAILSIISNPPPEEL
jgi:UDP-N-acetylglucosamine 4,6-dehydratase